MCSSDLGVGTALTEGKETRWFGDRQCVLETAITGELALVRADVADRYGNLRFAYAQANFGPAMATAAKVTVAEVREVSPTPLEHDRIDVSGVYVNRVVTVGDAQ